jgi:hypothetical protein
MADIHGTNILMDKTEARALLAQELARYRGQTYHDLAKLVDTNSMVQVRGTSGTEYQIEISVMWDSPREKTDVRVLGSIDDGHVPAAFFPLSDDFIIAPDGKFVGE